MALCCILFSMITYLLYWRTQNGHNDQCVVSTVLNWEEGTSPSICWQYLSRYPGYHYVIFWCFFLSASFISDSHSAHWPPGPLRSVSVDLLSSLMALSMSWCLRLFFHRFRTVFLLVELHDAPASPTLQPGNVSPLGGIMTIWFIYYST